LRYVLSWIAVIVDSYRSETNFIKFHSFKPM